jgi:hypothetical protein
MTTKQLGSFYRVDAQFFSPAVLRNYRSTLPDTERSCKVVKVKVLRLIPESRSYDCQVVGVAETVKLSSKSLVHKDAPGSRQDQPNNRTTSHRVSESAGDAEESESDEDEVAEDEAVDPAVDEVSLVGAKDWRPVTDFEDPLTSEHPQFEIDCCGRLRIAYYYDAVRCIFRVFLFGAGRTRVPCLANPCSGKRQEWPRKVGWKDVFELFVVAAKNGSDRAAPKGAVLY